MSKEVSITFKTSLEDVPREVVEFLEILDLKLENQLNSLRTTISDISKAKYLSDYSHCLVDMESIRRELYKIDNRIEDSMSILSAYHQHLAGDVTSETAKEKGSSVQSEDIVANYD